MLTNNAISMPVVIGILMLMGIVTKNAIMLVDFAIEEVKHGVPRAEAIIDAGRKRARPIVMTTIAMSAGMIPAAMALGDGGEFRAPMAIAVIGGLMVSTFLSLVFVPSFYTIMDDISIWSRRLFRWLVRPNAADEPGEAHRRACTPCPTGWNRCRSPRSRGAALPSLPSPAGENVAPGRNEVDRDAFADRAGFGVGGGTLANPRLRSDRSIAGFSRAAVERRRGCGSIASAGWPRPHCSRALILAQLMLVVW